MNGSDAREELAEKHEGDRERRIRAVRKWVEYIEGTPPEKWGPQQNALVDSQLDAARSAGLSAEHRRRVKDVSADLAEGSGEE